ncbi:MAG: hypothetical protein Q4D73_04995 [Actinomycetaceae bacterium]|nr:hypothetical protein [Actinomycetaceae bacterium]
MWALAVFVCLFIWHEVDEYRVLIPWLASNENRLPTRLARMRMNHQQFTVIALQQLVLILLIGLLAPPLWVKAMVVAYLVHLLLHCAQLVFTWVKGYFLPLYSAVLQVPLIAILLWFMRPPLDGVEAFAELLIPSGILVIVMFANLGIMNFLVRRAFNRKTS